MKFRLFALLRTLGLFVALRRLKMAAYRVLPPAWRDDAAAITFYRRFISQGDLVFDVGANVGIKTKTFLGLGARVVAVEPQPTVLKELTAVFGRDPRVTIVEVALASAEGQALMHRSISNSGRSTLSERFRSEGPFSHTEEWLAPVPVQTITMDALIESLGIPSFCKIDVEGFEDEVLSGMSHPVKTVSFEFHDELLDVAERCVALLDALGSYRYNVVWSDSADFGWEQWIDGPDAIESLRSANTGFEGEIYARLIDG